MALKTVIKFCVLILLYFSAQISSAQSEYKDIYHIQYVEKDSFELKKYSRKYNENQIEFFFRNEHSLKSPIFIFNKSNKISELDSVQIENIIFSHPWEAYWAYHKSKEKPTLFLYEYEKESNCYYKYPVTIEFPPPPPHPGPVKHYIEK